MILEPNNRTGFKVVELSDLPWKKIIRGNAKIREELQIRKEGEDTKAIGLVLSEDLALVIPKVLVDIPKHKLVNLPP